MEQLKQAWHTSPWAARWAGLPPRDQVALLLLGGFLALVLLYLLLWQPVAQQAQVAREAYQQERELYQYLQANAPQVRAAPEQSQTPVEAAQLQGVVARTAVEHGLSLERLDSEGSGRVQVNVQAAPFTDLLAWWVELEARGVRIDSLALNRAGEGKVIARLTLQVD